MNKIRSILLIDDDAISSWLNKTMLERTGLVDEIISIDNGQSAIDYLQACCSDLSKAADCCPDLILLDLDMPIVNGYGVLDALQKSANTAWIVSKRIMFLSTSINPMDQERASAYQVCDFLVKPLTDTKIKVVLEQFLNHKIHITAPEPHQNHGVQLPNDREPIARTVTTDIIPEGTNKESA